MDNLHQVIQAALAQARAGTGGTGGSNVPDFSHLGSTIETAVGGATNGMAGQIQSDLRTRLAKVLGDLQITLDPSKFPSQAKPYLDQTMAGLHSTFDNIGKTQPQNPASVASAVTAGTPMAKQMNTSTQTQTGGNPGQRRGWQNPRNPHNPNYSGPARSSGAKTWADMFTRQRQNRSPNAL
jgi:hypothetical protein